ncbi:MAG: hypothetical protein ACK56I_19200, partial [bacterium]
VKEPKQGTPPVCSPTQRRYTRWAGFTGGTTVHRTQLGRRIPDGSGAPARVEPRPIGSAGTLRTHDLPFHSPNGPHPRGGRRRPRKDGR